MKFRKKNVAQLLKRGPAPLLIRSIRRNAARTAHGHLREGVFGSILLPLCMSGPLRGMTYAEKCKLYSDEMKKRTHVFTGKDGKPIVGSDGVPLEIKGPTRPVELFVIAENRKRIAADRREERKTAARLVVFNQNRAAKLRKRLALTYGVRRLVKRRWQKVGA